jgi:hypothetical protein
MQRLGMKHLQTTIQTTTTKAIKTMVNCGTSTESKGQSQRNDAATTTTETSQQYNVIIIIILVHTITQATSSEILIQKIDFFDSGDKFI